MKNNWVKHSKSHLDTEKLGIEFSKIVSKGTIVLLNGDLGSGKTTFAKGVLRGLNYAEEVTSPTYTLINEYNADYDVIHIDCYREKNINRWLNIGLIDYFTTENILFIEWPGNIRDILFSRSVISLNFEIKGLDERLISMKEIEYYE